MAEASYESDSELTLTNFIQSKFLAESRIRTNPPSTSLEERAIAYELGYKQGLIDKLENQRIDSSFWVAGPYVALGTTGWVQASAKSVLPVSAKKEEPQCSCPSSLELRKKTRNYREPKQFKTSICRYVCQCDCRGCKNNGCGTNVCKNPDHCKLNKAFKAGSNHGYKRKANCDKCKEIRVKEYQQQ